MKKAFPFFILMFSLIISQSCETKKTTEDTTASTDSLNAVNSKKAVAEAKRAEWKKRTSEKTEQRRLAAAETAKKKSYKDASGKTIYYVAEAGPSFPGGQEALDNYLRNNLKYPKDAEDAGEEGTVYVDFVVDHTGKVINAVAADVVGTGPDVSLSLKEEAVRVVTYMPPWIAGMQKGKAIDTWYSIPITFQLMN